MSELEEMYLLPEHFDGRVRVFPLPNLVMFPHIVQALHIFEPRYRELLKDALAGDRLIAMGFLCPGWEKHSATHPAIGNVLCLGRIISHTRLAERKSNILLLGLRRARLIRELPSLRSYRQAQVELMEDVYPDEGLEDRPRRKRRLMDYFRRIVPKQTAAQGQLEQLLGSQVPLGVLTDLVAYSVHVDLEYKQDMLSEINVDRRAELLMDHLEKLFRRRSGAAKIGFPPQFSVN
jgi:ATP-dependent Lon protease